MALLVFAAAATFGTVFMANLDSDSCTKLADFLSGSATFEKEDNIAFSVVFKSCVLSNFKYICTYFILSLTVYSSWLCMAVPGVRGFAAGFTSAFLIKQYGIRGTLYSLLSIVPSVAVGLPVHFFAAVVCVNFAADRRRKGEMGARSAVASIPALGVIWCIMILSSLYDVFIAPVIFKYIF